MQQNKTEVMRKNHVNQQQQQHPYVVMIILNLLLILSSYETFSFVLRPPSAGGGPFLREQQPSSSIPKVIEVGGAFRIPYGDNNTRRKSKVSQTSPPIFQLYQSSLSSSSSDSNYSQAQALKRRNVVLPLLDLSSSTNADKMDDEIITPLPASHLPNELSTLHIYSIQLKAAIHKMMIQDTLAKFSPPPSSTVDVDSINYRQKEPMYGHVVGRSISVDDSNNDESSLVGCIGCASEIIIATPSDMLAQVGDGDTRDNGAGYSDFDDPLNDDSANTEDGTITVLSKGSFRFVIKNVTQTFPYPIAIVDELLDDCLDNGDNSPAATAGANDGDAIKEEIFYDDLGTFDDDDDDDDDDDYDDDMYAHLTPKELTERIFSAMKAIVDQKLSTKPKSISPLEASILEQSGMSPDAASMMESMQRDYAEEMAAVLDIFTAELVDIVPLSSKTERYYVIAMFAAEFGGLDNEVRKNILVTLDGVKRLMIVLEGLEKKISLVQAKKLTEGIVEKSDESSKDLMVCKYMCIHLVKIHFQKHITNL